VDLRGHFEAKEKDRQYILAAFLYRWHCTAQRWWKRPFIIHSRAQTNI